MSCVNPIEYLGNIHLYFKIELKVIALFGICACVQKILEPERKNSKFQYFTFSLILLLDDLVL